MRLRERKNDSSLRRKKREHTELWLASPREAPLLRRRFDFSQSGMLVDTPLTPKDYTWAFRVQRLRHGYDRDLEATTPVAPKRLLMLRSLRPRWPKQTSSYAFSITSFQFSSSLDHQCLRYME